MTATPTPGATLPVAVPCPRCGAPLPYTAKLQRRWYGWLVAVRRDPPPCRCAHGAGGHADLRAAAGNIARARWGLPASAEVA